MLVLLCLVATTLADDTPQGLIAKDTDQDLNAEATNSGAQSQKREAGLSNSYGEPLPPDAYGAPQDLGFSIISDVSLPAPIYGVPISQNTPPGAYGPPSPIFPTQNYEGPPPPPNKSNQIYGPPKPVYGPPKPIYGPPKSIYGSPKKTYGLPKQNLPKSTFGALFKPQKISFPKQNYGAPKPVYGPPKPIYGLPPKPVYGPPKATILPEVPALQVLDLPPVNLPNVGRDFATVNVGTDIDQSINLPAPVYGTPFPNFNPSLKPDFTQPLETYGTPGQVLGPIGPSDQLLVQDLGSIGHYGPPQPDPNPKPPHPGIPAPPTPPHVLYDGWKPIPGLSKPLNEHITHNELHIDDQYGPPPPPPPKFNSDFNFDGLSLPHLDHGPQFSSAQISSSYSSVHQDALANIDLNALIGGESNHIDQSKTVFEAHYSEPGTGPATNNFVVQAGIPLVHEKPFDTYGPPPLPSGPHQSVRAHGAKELIPPSGIYGVPPGSKYGAPPKPPPASLPIPYGTFSGGGHSIHTGGNTPRHPIKFREPVPDGLLQQVGHSTHHKDVHGHDHLIQGPTYLPPPVRDIKDVNHNSGNHGINSFSLSIEPSNLYSLPHSGNPINFNSHSNQPSNLYGSPIDSYSVPLLTVGDHTASGSNSNAVTATLDGTILANLSNLEAAAILKHCPYHEQILKAARNGEKIPSELASSYVASLSSLGSALKSNQLNSFDARMPESESDSYGSNDLSTASQTLAQTVLPGGEAQKDQEKIKLHKEKPVKENDYTQEGSLQLSKQIFQTSEKIKNLDDETKQLQQKIVSSNQHLKGKYPHKYSSKINTGSYSLQIQSSDGKQNEPSIPHNQLLSEELLQSILHAVEQPSAPSQNPNQAHFANNPVAQHKSQSKFGQRSPMDLTSLDVGGIDLPAGYEPVDRTKEKTRGSDSDQEVQASNKDLKQVLGSEIVQTERGDVQQNDCDVIKADNSIRHVVVVPPPGLAASEIKPVEEIDENDVAIYFGQPAESETKSETATEITVATSISEEENLRDDADFGEKLNKKRT